MGVIMSKDHMVLTNLKKRPKKSREQRTKTIKHIFVFAVVQLILVSVFIFGFRDHLEMNGQNTEEIVGHIDHIDVQKTHQGSVYIDITVDSERYSMQTEMRILKMSVESIDELKEISNEDFVTVTIQKGGNKFVGLKSASKIYYDVNNQYNFRARQNRLALIATICLVELSVITLYLLICFPKLVIELFYSRKRKIPK